MRGSRNTARRRAAGVATIEGAGDPLTTFDIVVANPPKGEDDYAFITPMIETVREGAGRVGGSVTGLHANEIRPRVCELRLGRTIALAYALAMA